MQIGFNAPTAGPLAAADDSCALVTGGEALGFDYATFSDHVVIPTDIHAKYPYSATGEFPAGARAERHEQLIEVAFVAAKTTKLRLVTSVMVVPHRPAVLTAKMLSTIDVLSGGRLTVGIGAGWMKEEFEAIDAPDFAERGKVTDEYIEAFNELWTKRRAALRRASYVRFDNIVFAPKPVQKPHPPIWVGGESGPALRRTAQLGDAWYPIGTNPANPARQPDALQDAGVATPAQDDRGGRPRPEGRRPRPARARRYGESVPAKAGDGERRLFSGKPADIAADIRALREIGVGHLDFGFGGNTVDAMLVEMQQFRKDVLSLV